MSIMDMFRTAVTPNPAAAQVPGTPATPGQIPAGKPTPTEANATTAANGVVPDGASNEPAKPPIDEFKDLWQPPAVDPNAPKDTNIFNVDPKKLMEAAGKIDFSKVVKPEIMARVVAGGEDGAKAMMEAMNVVTQQVYAQSSFATTKIVEQAVAKATEQFTAKIPDLVKQQQLRDSTLTENPALSHPAAQPVVQAIQTQLQLKYPNATAAELRSMTSKYFDGLLEAANAPKTAAAAEVAATKKAATETDWSTFL
jgi:hypothetical protein